VAILACAFGCGGGDITPASKELAFDANGNFRILQLTDIQLIQAGLEPNTKALLDTVIDSQAPDMIIITGDNTSSEDFSSIKDKATAKAALLAVHKEIVDYMTSKNIPWSATFGNHDALYGIAPKSEIFDVYTKSPTYIGGWATDAYANCYVDKEAGNEIENTASGYNIKEGTYTNFSIPVKSNDKSKTLYNIYLFDCQTSMNKYLPILDSQIAWYEAQRDALKAANGGAYVPSILFTHESAESFKNAYHNKDNSEIVSKYYGEVGDGDVFPPENGANFDEAVLSAGDMKGMFFGHDHLNTFNAVVKNNGHKVFMAYARISSFAKYMYANLPMSYSRGGRIIDIKADGNLTSFDVSCKATNKAYTQFEVNTQYQIDLSKD
ncbi:MAG: metallophosphoesterase, partial [Clostridia bacterium]